MSVTTEELATAISYTLDARMGVLEPGEEPTLSDLELAESLLARFDISAKR